MQEKDIYTLEELFDSLPMPLVQLAKLSATHEVTIARMRDGEKTRRDTVNRILLALSKVYNLDINIRNVTGINVLRNLRKEAKEARMRKAEEEKSDDKESHPLLEPKKSTKVV